MRKTIDRLIVTISLCILAMCVAIVYYELCGSWLIMEMYEGRSAEILNNMIVGQALWPVDAYLLKAHNFFCRVIYLLFYFLSAVNFTLVVIYLRRIKKSSWEK